MTTNQATATVKGAGAWKSPAWYGAGMPMPDTVEGRRRAHLAMAGIQRVLIDQGHLQGEGVEGRRGAAG